MQRREQSKLPAVSYVAFVLVVGRYTNTIILIILYKLELELEIDASVNPSHTTDDIGEEN